MTRLASPISSLKNNYDVIIIGSGYGGGVSASRLARAGKRVAVLERGREILTGEFPSRFPDLKNDLQVTAKSIKTGNDDAMFDVRVGEDMHVLVGRGLGGGSLVNAGVALRPDDRVFQDEVWPGEFRQDGTLDKGYARAEQWLNPSAHTAGSELTKFQALNAAADDVAPEDGSTHKVVHPRLVVSFEKNVNAAGIEQPACTLCGDCCGGCNVGAKNTVALTYLPDAVAHGAELFTHIKASHLEKSADDTWQVTALHTPDPKRGDTDSYTLTAPMVILSAGTLGSSEILLRSAERGLNLSPRLGKGFSANGDIIAFGYGATPAINAVGIGHPAKIPDFEVGTAVTGQLEVHDDATLENQMCVQDGVLPSALAPVLPYMFLPNGRIVGALKSLINGVYKGPFAHLQTFFAVSHDSASGTFTLEGDRLALKWPGAKDEPVYQRLDAMLEKIVEKSGGTYIKNPLAGTVMGHQPATAHPLGGCSIGADRDHGVVNHKGQVFDGSAGHGSNDVHDGLYVIDGSIIPRSLGVNPLLTITALAERALIHMQADHGLSFDTEPLKVSQAIPATAPGSLAISAP